MSERPKAARRYEAEEAELTEMIQRHRYAAEMNRPFHEREILTWLDRTLYQHREEARAEGMRSWGRPTGWKGWWERNWFPVVMLVMIGGGSLLIGFVNGWS